MRMTQSTQTLESYLRQQDPKIIEPGPQFRSKSRPHKSTTNLKYANLSNGTIKKWEGFTPEKLLRCFEGALSTTLQRQFSDLHDYAEIHEIDLRVHSESCVTALVGKYHQNVVNEALHRTSMGLLKQTVDMAQGSQASMVYADSGRFMPDWAGVNSIERPESRELEDNIIPGESKTSWSWSTQRFEDLIVDNRLKDPDSKDVWPLRQLAFYCTRSYARYGYIITDKELFVMRIGSMKKIGKDEYQPEAFLQDVFDHPKIEYMSIPWRSETTAAATDELTITLGLWILHLLAANDGYLGPSEYRSLENTKVILPEVQKKRVPPRKKPVKDGPKLPQNSEGSQQVEGASQKYDGFDAVEGGSTRESSPSIVISQPGSFSENAPDPTKLLRGKGINLRKRSNSPMEDSVREDSSVKQKRPKRRQPKGSRG